MGYRGLDCSSEGDHVRGVGQDGAPFLCGGGEVVDVGGWIGPRWFPDSVGGER